MHVATSAYLAVSTRWHELRARSERGLTTTEVAVLTFILVGIAIVIGGLLLGVGRDAVEGIDETPTITDPASGISTGPAADG